MIGTKVNYRYRIDSELGQGGMGTVYKGYDTTLERDIAIKMMTETRLGTKGRNRLLHEAKAIAQLSHPNIVTVFDAGEYEQNPFIVMEFVEGINLYEQPPKDIKEIVNIMQQVCAALSHAHEHGIIHRDLKPENVILTANGTVKLMDFGLARSISSRLTSEGTILGTVFYLAPEQAQGRAIDQRSDLYSLGVMLYELTTGELPFIADDPLAVVSQHIHAPVMPPRVKNDQVPPALEALIQKLLKKDPAKRPASAKEVLERLSAPEMLDVTALPLEELSVLDRIVAGRLVGREQEMRQTRQMWGDTIAGQGQLLLISGEPGVGKTRLMREIVTQAEVSGGTALIGQSYAEGDPAFSPFRQILRAGLRLARESDLEIPEAVLVDLLTIAPELRPDFPDLPDYYANDAENQQQGLFDQFLYFFNLLTKHIPVLLVLEDAHWTDASSLRLLRHLMRNTRSQRLMVLATYREVELDEARALHETLLDFQREQLGRRLKLKRLTRQETHDMLAILFADEIKPDFLEGIYRETDGNPFFIEEVCKAIVESGKLTFEEGRWKRPNMAEVGVPQSIQVAIQARLGVLSENAQKTLEQAAILGREFNLELLQRAMGTDEDSLLDALDEALRARLVEEVRGNGDERFSFVHALIPTTITTSLRTLRRRRLHRRVALALEALQPEAYEALAYQFIEAGETDQGVDYLIKAGDQARGLFAHEEAISNYRQALDHLRDAGDMAQAANILMKLGLTYHDQYRFPEAREAYAEAFKLRQQAGGLEAGEAYPPAPHAFRSMAMEPNSIDPLFGDGWARHIIDNLFSGLVELTSNWDIVPDMAQRWEVLDEGRLYVFHLREDIFWSDGVPVTAYDFEFAWKRALDPVDGPGNPEMLFVIKNARSYHQGQLDDPEAIGITARDAVTLEVELERPFNSFLYLLGNISLFPVPRHVLQEHGPAWTKLEHLVTNGPFRLTTWERGKFLRLEANDTYPARFPGNLRQVEMRFYPDQQNTVGPDLYRDDQVDMLYWEFNGNVYDFKRLRSQYPADYRVAPFLLATIFVFNTRLPPFDDSRVRKAFVLATDRKNLAIEYFGDSQDPATGGLLPPGMPGYSEGIALPFDPDRARQLLTEAGYPNGREFPILKIFGTSGKLERQWHDSLGIEFKGHDKSELDMAQRHQEGHVWGFGFYATYPVPLNFLQGYILGESGWSNDEYNALIDRASQTLDFAESIKYYQQAEQILVEEAPVFPISYGKIGVFVKPWVRNFPQSPGGSWYWKEVILETH